MILGSILVDGTPPVEGPLIRMTTMDSVLRTIVPLK